MKLRKIKLGCGIAFIVLIILIIGFFWAFNEAFGKEEYTVTIDQNIGGKLVSDVNYSADLQSWYYFIDYKYIDPKGEIYDFGQGLYQGEEWDENDQLFQFKNWTILPTETDFESIKFISMDLSSGNKAEFVIEPHSIQEDSLWQSKNIKSALMWSPSGVKLDTIINNKIFIEYTYRIDRENVENLGTHLVEYEIEEKSGIPRMKNLKQIK
ncbi:hypothetical protein RM545_17250 [Zunongwangia sp. F260]|uniref:Uncharacterized protein n=1 Tax=Autumnicola lenta TaxID=3075593 RepID=A0ABU3CQ16_9FLAO|nr:hypothetical protein [Zunongwangia sp. F260]MDT0648437.1 hypothetical protein [Zunongwangia sp. F260]